MEIAFLPHWLVTHAEINKPRSEKSLSIDYRIRINVTFAYWQALVNARFLSDLKATLESEQVN